MPALPANTLVAANVVRNTDGVELPLITVPWLPVRARTAPALDSSPYRLPRRNLPPPQQSQHLPLSPRLRPLLEHHPMTLVALLQSASTLVEASAARNTDGAELPTPTAVPDAKAHLAPVLALLRHCRLRRQSLHLLQQKPQVRLRPRQQLLLPTLLMDLVDPTLSAGISVALNAALSTDGVELAQLTVELAASSPLEPALDRHQLPYLPRAPLPRPHLLPLLPRMDLAALLLLASTLVVPIAALNTDGVDPVTSTVLLVARAHSVSADLPSLLYLSHRPNLRLLPRTLPPPRHPQAPLLRQRPLVSQLLQQPPVPQLLPLPA